MPRHVWRWYRYSVRCQDCDWELLDSKNGQGLAAQHCDRYDHTVYVDVVGSVTYTHKEGQPSGMIRFPGDDYG